MMIIALHPRSAACPAAPTSLMPTPCGPRQGVPTGEYHVDAAALRRARQGVPTGEYHHA